MLDRVAGKESSCCPEQTVKYPQHNHCRASFAWLWERTKLSWLIFPRIFLLERILCVLSLSFTVISNIWITWDNYFHYLQNPSHAFLGQPKVSFQPFPLFFGTTQGFIPTQQCVCQDILILTYPVFSISWISKNKLTNCFDVLLMKLIPL